MKNTKASDNHQTPLLKNVEDLNLEIEGAKNRRKRIMESLSFETECHNIYSPHFTSEEDQSS
jgi:hypothetical protein